ncbi:unnamed protein product [Urochloa humidicola]
MGVLLFLVSLLVVLAEGGRYVGTVTEAMDRTKVAYYASPAELKGYWQSLFPNSTIPPAILNHFHDASGNKMNDKEKEHYWSLYSDKSSKGDENIVHNWLHWTVSEKFLYPETAFTTGTKIHLYIDRAAALHSAYLRCDIADSIPMSTENFKDITAMFAPVSLSMARDMWSTLASCEHPQEVANQKKACTTSLKSMHGFSALALGTSDLRAFSTPLDVPEEGISSPSQRYEVAEVRAITTKATTNTVMCHSMNFPVALFLCHAVNPTRVYEVTLQREYGVVTPESRAPAMVHALVVCHVNTSGFDPTLRYWVKLGLKPGEAPVCHFLTRGDVLWAPVSTT